MLTITIVSLHEVTILLGFNYEGTQTSMTACIMGETEPTFEEALYTVWAEHPETERIRHYTLALAKKDYGTYTLDEQGSVYKI